MWTACAEAADHPAGNWDFSRDIHFLITAEHGLSVFSTHRYRYRSQQWITAFSASQKTGNFFQILCFAQTSNIFFLSGCPDRFRLVQRKPFQEPPELLSRNQPCFWWGTRPLEASFPIQPFVHQNPSVPVMVQGFQLTGITATEQEYRFGIRIQLVSILNEQY